MNCDDAVGAEEERERDGEHRQRREAGELQPLLARGAALDGEQAHARTTSGEPNSPFGRTSRTTKMIASGTRIFRSEPMKPM